MTSQTLGSDPHYTVPVYWVREVIELLLPEHPRWVARALGAAALHWSELSEENAKIGQIQEVDFIQALARLSDNPYFAPEIGLRLNGRTSSVVSYILHSARTMGEAMTINAQILPLTRPGFVVEAHADGVAGRFVVGNRDPWVRRHPAYGEFMMSAAISAYRTATGRLIHPIQVQLAQPQSSRGPRLSHLWGCPVVMEAPFHAVDFGAELMDLPLVQSDAALHQHLVSYGEQLLRAQPANRPSIRQDVEREILAHLPGEAPSIADIAGRLGLSARTLTRRLGDQDLTFRGLLDQVRAGLARIYLADPTISLAEVAFLLGYSDQSSFSSAFRRWTDQTPRAFRSAKLGRIG